MEMRASVTNRRGDRAGLRRGGMLAASMLFVSAAFAEEPCGLCDSEIVINSALATCFLENFQQYADKANGAVIVDLTGCEQDRSVVEPLAMPGAATEEPDTQFMVTKAQLDCLKAQLEQPDVKLDPSARIELGSCG